MSPPIMIAFPRVKRPTVLVQPKSVTVAVRDDAARLVMDARLFLSSHVVRDAADKAGLGDRLDDWLKASSRFCKKNSPARVTGGDV
jgi:hypothetical protein